MINFAQHRIVHHPYPMGVAEGVLPWSQYEELVAAFPPVTSMRHLTGAYHKYALSERVWVEEYVAWIRAHECWARFYQYIKSPRFLDDTFGFLATRGLSWPSAPYKARFEFSALPPEGGGIAPHRDIPGKILTFVLGMQARDEWQPEWGGGTDQLVPLDPTARLVDYQAPREAFRLVTSWAHEPNACVIFVKTDASWHSVGPIQGPLGGPLRKTLTINIERVAA